MKKVSILLLCATMLCYTGVTKAEASAKQKVSKIDACIENNIVNAQIEFSLRTYDVLPAFAMIQGDMYYSETIVYCDFVEKIIEEVYLEPDSPVPLTASTFSDILLKVG